MIAASMSHLWQSTLFAIVAGLLTVAFRNNRAQVRYCIWFIASCKFLVPFSLLTILGSHLQVHPTTRIVTPQIARTIAIDVMPFILQSSAALPQQERPHEGDRAWIPIMIAGLWVLGSVTVALVRFRGWMQIRAAVRSSSPIDVPAPVEVRSSPGLLEPGVVGMFRPVLLLPVDIEERLTQPQFDAVLAHELCHVRRHDNLLALIHVIPETIFWFHPLVWWIGAKLIQERERACDEEVLSLGSEPRVYAEGILNVCKLYLESPLRCVSGVTGSNVKERIENIMINRSTLKLTFARKAALACAGIAVIAIPIMVGTMNPPSASAQSPAPLSPAKFETATVRPCNQDTGMMKGAGRSVSRGILDTGCMPLVDGNFGLVQRAYVRFAGGQAHWPGVVPIEGGPAWMRNDLYQISARAAGNPSPEMMEGPMLQALLEERFKLRLHRETRDVPVYVLTAPQGVSLLKSFPDGSCIAMPLQPPMPTLPQGQHYCKVRIGVRPPAVDSEGTSLSEFSQLLDLVLDRPIIDKTGIAGKFDIHLEFRPDASTPSFLPGGESARFATVPTDPATASMLVAIQRLGLKLEAATGPREFLVVDHLEKPVE